MTTGNYKDFAAKSSEEVLKALASTVDGLSTEEARRRGLETGPNEFVAKRTSVAELLLRQLRSPLIYMLAVAGLISYALGEPTDGTTIFVILLLDTGIGFVQEYRSSKALEKLAEHLQPRARVRRGKITTIPRKELVPGDIVVLQPGDIVPADLRVVKSHNLTVDESALTGESVNVVKSVEAMAKAPDQPYQAANVAFMMSRIDSGTAEAVVFAIRDATVLGSVARLAEETERISAFQRNVETLSRFLLKAVLLILGAVLLTNLLIKGTGSFIEQLLFAVAMAVSVIPEALPAVTAITLSKGAMTLSRRHVVVKRLSAIEDLGHIQVLCTDKTGTITESVMRVAASTFDDPKACLRLAMATAAEEEWQDIEKPKTFAAALMASATPEDRSSVRKNGRKWFTPFDPSRRRAMSVIGNDEGFILTCFGAPEVVLGRCDRAKKGGRDEALPESRKAELLETIREEGKKGHRVLALATRHIADKASYGEADETGLAFRGWVSFEDPLKSTARKAIQDAKRLNLQVKILTGDGPEVAGAVGKAVGIIEDAEAVISGSDIDAMSESDLHEAVDAYMVFARVSPEQKYKIIDALQRRYQVGFLGEGINDAPALKLANVSLVVQGASDVAREAADVILLRKDLHVIIEGVREGRVIFGNIVKYIKYTLVGNLGNFLAIAGISLSIDYLPMLPVQILMTNLLTDLPLVSVADDSVEPEELRSPKQFNIRELAFAAVFLGIVSSMFDFIYFSASRHLSPAAVQTSWFTLSVLTELALIFSIRARGPFWKAPPPSRWLVIFSVAAAALAIWLPMTGFGASTFHFLRPDPARLALTLILVGAYFVLTEAVKVTYAKFFPSNPQA